jgi:hypothetical protein
MGAKQSKRTTSSLSLSAKQLHKINRSEKGSWEDLKIKNSNSIVQVADNSIGTETSFARIEDNKVVN